MTILVTGFGPYREPENASGELVQSLIDDPPDLLEALADRPVFKVIHCDTRSRELEHADLERQLHALLDEYRPSICIHTGQSPAVSCITLERVARNIFLRLPIDERRPARYLADLPGLAELDAVLAGKNIPAGFSEQCGEHACNHILYSSRHFAESEGYSHRAGFVHIPLLPGQFVAGDSDPPRMPLATTRTALCAIIEHVASYSLIQAG